MQNSHPDKSRYFIHSLAKGLECIRVIAQAEKPVSLSDLALAMNINKSTLIRFCYTLEELGYIQRDANKKYHLTPNILHLGYPAVCGMGWRDIATYHLRKLFEEVNETVSLSVLDGNEIIFLIRFRNKRYLPFDIRMGTRIPVHCTAMGKVLMAFGQPDRVHRILEDLAFKPLTSRTITDREVYLDVLRDVKRKGYAVNDEEMSIGNRSIAAPVIDENGFATAAIVIAVQAMEYTITDLEKKFTDKIMECAGRISESLIKSENKLGGHNQF
jgi:IclR family pca regulon transcriptional regulator